MAEEPIGVPGSMVVHLHQNRSRCISNPREEMIEKKGYQAPFPL